MNQAERRRQVKNQNKNLPVYVSIVQCQFFNGTFGPLCWWDKERISQLKKQKITRLNNLWSPDGKGMRRF